MIELGKLRIKTSSEKINVYRTYLEINFGVSALLALYPMKCNNMAVDAFAGISHMLCNQLIPQSLHSLSHACLKLIENASSDQIATSINCNQHEINTLLIQLLAINFINKNQDEIRNDINTINSKKDVTSNNQSNDDSLKDYCEHKLLEISPIGGFSRKNYLIECNINDDIRIEIISYLKPNEIFKNISLINKQFSKNVQKIHQSHKHGKTFCNKNYTYQSLGEIQLLWAQYIYDIDWRMANGQWVSGEIDDIDMNDSVVNVTSKVDGIRYWSTLEPWEIASHGRMVHRPGNISRFINVLKHGYFSAACDINLKQFSWIVNDREFNIISGYVEDTNIDIWQCGWIDFDWTWKEAVKRNEYFTKNHHENFPENSENSKSSKNFKKSKKHKKKFRLFQIGVTIDITKAYNTYDKEQRRSFRNCIEPCRSRKTNPNQRLVTLVFHIDDIENITYFGHKTTLEQQLTTKQHLFDSLVTSYNKGRMDTSKHRILDAVGYRNYCVGTSLRGHLFSAMSENEQERNQYKAWRRNPCAQQTAVYERECMNIQVSQNGVNKVYYDKVKDELLVKTVSWFRSTLRDKNAPSPLKKKYDVYHGSFCRLVEAKIVDSKLIDKVRKENFTDVNEKEKRYFELLREWKGFIRTSIDITKGFNQFQERLKDEYFGKNKNNQDENEKENEWDNRKYFLDELNYDSKTDKITRHSLMLLDSTRVYGYDTKFNYFDIFGPGNFAGYHVLTNMLEFVAGQRGHGIVLFEEQKQLGLVCKTWYQLYRHK